jgi:penicillin-binding protein 1A
LPASDRKLRRRRLWWRLITIAALLITAMAALLAGVVSGVYSSMTEVLPPPGDITSFRPAEGVRVYSADGVLLGRVAREHRQFLPITDIPSDLQLAAIAVEDRRFYRHHGVDPRGVLAALRDNLLGGRIVRGGSTITQQLARNVYLSPKRTLGRKLQEMILALQIERTFSKEEILELYLNQVYYGNGAYGVQVAAETYFDRPLRALSLSQCALLAGLPQRPSDYNPFLNPQAAKHRRDEVIERLREQGYITPEEAEKARRRGLDLGQRKPPLGMTQYKAPYFTSYVLHQLTAELGANVIYHGDLRVHTTLDWEMQQAAERAVRAGVTKAKGQRVSEGALVALDWKTGAIKALVGGLDYRADQYSCATQARRQAGSAFKPFVYAAAMDSGFTPDSTMVDRPVTYKGAGGKPWIPKNADRRYRGRVTLRYALVHSINVVAVKLLDEVGVPKVIDYAHRMGIRDRLDPYLSLALGTSGVTALDMASAFGVFAGGGQYVAPRPLDRIADRNDNVVSAYRPRVRPALAPATAATMDDMLRDVVTRGTGYRARIAWPAAGKTGTASDYKDAWFIGYTDRLVCAVWVGNRDSTPMRRVFGGTVPASIWKDFMTAAMKTAHQRDAGASATPEQRRARPTTVTPEPPERRTPAPLRVTVCADSGKLARPECPNTRVVQYSPAERASAPRTSCDIHGPTAGGAPEAGRTITLGVCAESGKLATEYCPHVINKRFAPADAPSATCDVHLPPRSPDGDATLW